MYSLVPQLNEGKEMLAYPAKLSEGKVWGDVEDVHFRVALLNASIETPTKKYTNCMLIEVIDENGEVFMKNYFVEGIGAVAAESKGKLSLYLKEYKFD